jgi:hypothetical protein
MEVGYWREEEMTIEMTAREERDVREKRSERERHQREERSERERHQREKRDQREEISERLRTWTCWSFGTSIPIFPVLWSRV